MKTLIDIDDRTS